MNSRRFHVNFSGHEIGIEEHDVLVPTGVLRNAEWCITCDSPFCSKVKSFNNFPYKDTITLVKI